MKYLFLIICLVFSGSLLQGAEVKKRLKKKRILISEGKKSGFTKGQEVCIYDGDDNEIVCATIYKAKNKKSYIKIKKKKIFKKIKKGMTVKLKSAETETQAATTDGSTTTGPKGATNIKLGYMLTPLTPSIYNVVSYLDPDGNTVNTLWDADQVASLSLFGFGAEFGFSLWNSKAVIGVRSREYKGFTIKANYTSTLANFAETSLEASAVGFYFDFNYFILDYGTMSIDFGNGLDVDSAQLTMTTDQKNDDDASINNRIYEASSTAQTISLRTNLNVNFFFDPIGIQMGTSLLIPLSTSVSDSITAQDSQTSNLEGETAEGDVRQAIGHAKGSIALEMLFSTYFAF